MPDEEKIPVNVNNSQDKPKPEPEKQPEPGEKPVAEKQPETSPDKAGENPKVVAPAVKSRRHPVEIALILVLVVALAAVGYLAWRHYHHKTLSSAATASSTISTKQTESTTQQKIQGLQLSTTKNYGNKYADGVLPVGDGKYTTSSAKQGYVYACSQYAQNLANDSGGAMTQGPWFTDGGKEYNVNKKVHVEGSVMWHGSLTDTVSGSTRTIVSNDLPINDPTGVFPISSSDPAYSYDHNPNTITAQSFTYNLSASPTYGSPNCESGQVGVMLTGVAIFNALDAGGRDAGAWEVQDGCDGHPQSDGIYHYHTLSSCIKDTSVNTVIGFAMDGFPITGPKVGNNNYLTTADLDECHGIVSQINLDGKNVTMYHYVMTQDFPYSVSCFRSKAATPPGQGQGGGQKPGHNKVSQSTTHSGQPAGSGQTPSPRP